jgi:hypothetical protein
MPSELTKQEWEASACPGKSSTHCGPGTRITYDIYCVACKQRACGKKLKGDKSTNGVLLCDYAPSSRCSSMKEDETTIDTVIDEFIAQVEPRDGVNMVDIDTIINYFLTSISHYWDCMECKC